MKKLLLIIAVITISGCATGPAFVPSKEPDDKSALLYIYRPSDFVNSMISPEIIINDKKYNGVTNGGYLYSYVEAGNYSIGINYGSNENKKDMDIDIKGGNTYYVRVTTGQKPLKYPYTLTFFNVENATSDNGKKEITDTSLISKFSLNGSSNK